MDRFYEDGTCMMCGESDCEFPENCEIEFAAYQEDMEADVPDNLYDDEPDPDSEFEATQDAFYEARLLEASR